MIKTLRKQPSVVYSKVPFAGPAVLLDGMPTVMVKGALELSTSSDSPMIVGAAVREVQTEAEDPGEEVSSEVIGVATLVPQPVGRSDR